MLQWHLSMASMNDLFRSLERRGIIRRVLPILTREYSAEEVEQIKYSIHFQLLLGLELILVFTDTTDYLHNTLGSDNLVVVRKMTFIDSDRAYDEDSPIRLAVVRNTMVVNNVYRELSLLTKKETSLHLRYGRYTLTSARINTHTQYRDLLFYLQNGKCAISGEPLNAGEWHVDHIYPLDHGGNNSLINLRGITKPCNQAKRDEVTEPRHCFTSEQLHRYELGSEFYQRIADRKLEGVPCGFGSVFGRDLRALE